MSERRNIKKFVGFVLDASGSMSNGRDETIKAYNEQIEEIKSHRNLVETIFTRSIFGSGNTEAHTWTEDIANLPNLTKREYCPGGNTPLYDAIGGLVDLMGKLPDADHPSASFLVVVFTDGYENASRKWTQKDLANRIKGLQNSGRWTFVYIGTEHDFSQATNLGIPINNTMMYNKSAAGFHGMSARTKSAIGSYMASTARSSTGLFGHGLTEDQVEREGQASLDSLGK
jgi:hypothetical protein